MSKSYLSSLADPAGRYEQNHILTKPKQGVSSQEAYAEMARLLFRHSIWAERSLAGRLRQAVTEKFAGRRTALGAHPPAIIDVPEPGDYAMATITVPVSLLRYASRQAGFTGGVSVVAQAIGGEACRRTIVPGDLQQAWGGGGHQMRAYTIPLAGLLFATSEPLYALVGKELGMKLGETIGDPTVSELPTARKD